MVYVAELNTNNRIKLRLSPLVCSSSPEKCHLLPHVYLSLYHMPLDGSLACLFGYYKALKRTQTIKRRLPGLTAISRHTLAWISWVEEDANTLP